jgi:Ca2+-binding RTX toxin-like protein
MRGTVAALFAAMVAVAALAPASAVADVTIDAPDQSTIAVTTTSAEANDLTITRDSSGTTVTENNMSVAMSTAGACMGSGPNVAECPGTASQLTMTLGDGNDHATVQAPMNSTIFGEGGDDTLVASDSEAGVDRLDGGGGNDTLAGGGGADTLAGDAGTDALSGGPDGDALSGGDGVDTLSGGAGDDRIDGGPGDDTVGVAAPVVIGATLLPTEPGNDVLSGGPGNDRLDPGVGGGNDRDVLVGDDGQDTVSYGLRSTPVVTTKDGIANDGQVGEGDNIGGDVERIDGGLASDSVGGGPGADILDGGPGNDAVVGFAGDDAENGGTGADTLRGGPGADQLVGGPDRDLVSYAGEPGATVRLDRGTGRTARRGDRDRIAEVEDVLGGSQGDTLTGSSGANSVDGTAGHDYVDGGRGVDVLAGGPSADVVASRDGTRDQPVSCGPGQDLAIVDRKDRVVRRGANRCEQVDDGSRTKPSPGRVYVQPQRCAGELGLPAMHRLVPLRYSLLLASGYRRRSAPTLDTSDCTVRMTATPGAGASASADVSGGAVTVDQSSGRRVATTLTVKRPACGAGGRSLAARARESRARVNTRRRRGRWRVRGRFSIGASFGTDWTTIEGCTRTTTVVRRGRVRVYDRVRRRTITVRAGHRYVARAGRVRSRSAFRRP